MHATTPRRLALTAALVAVSALALYLLLPRLAGLDDTWARLHEGDVVWLAVALVFEVASFAGYLALFEAILAPPPARLDRRGSIRITLAGVAATRLLAAGGAGGIALTVWALRHAGLGARAIATRMTTFMVLLYGVFMIALLVFGLGLYAGLLPGPAPWGLTVVPAAFGGIVIVAALALALVPRGLDGAGRGRVARWIAVGSASVGEGVRGALRAVRHPQPRLLGAIAWWAFDIATLWACLRAFGGEIALAPLVLAYFVGQLGNLLPVPGGLGGVEGGMIGALAGFGVPGGLAIAAVLAYRAFAFWLPTVPGVVAYVRLLRDARTQP